MVRGKDVVADLRMSAAVRTGGAIRFSAGAKAPGKPGMNEVLVSVRAAGINPIDYKLPKLLGGTVAGLDLAGVAVAVGHGVKGFKEGDEVFGFAKSGSVAEQALCDGAKLALKPKELAFTDAAALPTAYLTSLQALRTHGKLQAGGSVLVIGASGGCGLSGVKLAKALGAAEVVGVTSSKNAELVKAAGASRTVDYTSEAEMSALLSEGPTFDVVYDCATGSGKGEDYVKAAKAVVKSGGVTVAINGKLCDWMRSIFNMQPKGRKMMLTKQNSAELGELIKLLGTTGIEIDSLHELSEAGVDAAFDRLKSRRARGKVVITVMEAG